jgi:hypothetical protein
VLLGAALVAFLFPKREEEEALLAAYHQADVGSPGITLTGDDNRRRVGQQTTHRS